MKKRRIEIILWIMLFAFVFPACSGLNIKTPKQQATAWMDVYNAQYADTMSIMTNPASTEAQKDIGRKKKAILQQVWPMLKVYVSIVDKGGVPSDEDGQAINDLLNQLVLLVI